MKQMKTPFVLLTLLLLAMGCDSNFTVDNTGTSDDGSSSGTSATYNASLDATVADLLDANQNSHNQTQDWTWDDAAVAITLSGNTIESSGSAVEISGSTAVIKAGGAYIISGTLNDGHIEVDSDDSLTVKLILNQADITSSTTSPIFVRNADKTVVILADNTINTLTDGSSYVYEDADEDEPNAALFSKDDLSVGGSGALHINARYNDGIGGKDGVVIQGGTLSIEAVDDGIRGKDYVIMSGGTLQIAAGGDGIKSDNEDESDRGYILMEGGQVTIASKGDGMDAETDVLMTGGALSITGGGGSSAYSGTLSIKGMKAGRWLVVDNGICNINTADDALHSNAHMVLHQGTFNIACNDDALHADSSVVINDADITVSTCEEGIESYVIGINGGSVKITADDDCFNATAGSRTESNDGSCTYIQGGSIVLNTASGDGLDSNGSMVMSGGTVVVHGPNRNPEVSIDYNGSFNVGGGTLICTGTASNMAQAPSSSSDQYSVKITFQSTQSSSKLLNIQDSDGNTLITLQPRRQYQTVVFSSPDLVKGDSYTVYTGGSCDGENTEGLYTGGSYTGGSKTGSFKISSKTTSVVI